MIENSAPYKLLSENLFAKDVELSLQRRSSQDDLDSEGTSEDEDEGVELYQTPPSAPRNEEIPNHSGSVISQTALSEHGIDIATPPISQTILSRCNFRSEALLIFHEQEMAVVLPDRNF